MPKLSYAVSKIKMLTIAVTVFTVMLALPISAGLASTPPHYDQTVSPTPTIDPDLTADDAYVIAIAFYNEAEYNLAYEYFTIALEVDPNFVDAYYMRGATSAALDNNADAIVDYSNAINNGIDRLDFVYYARGVLYYDMGEYQQALNDYTEAIRLNPAYSSAYYNRALAHEQQGNFELALNDYSVIVNTLDPTDIDAWLRLGIINNDLGFYEASIESLDVAIGLDPTLNAAYLYRGIAYSNLEDYETAIADFDRAIERLAYNADAYFYRGLAYYDLGDYDNAIADYTEAIRLNPAFSFAYFNRALTYEQLGELETALEDYTSAVAIDPHDSDAWINRAYVEYALELYEDAIESYASILDYDPDFPNAYWGLGNSYYMLERYDEALANYQAYVALVRVPEPSVLETMEWIQNYAIENTSSGGSPTVDSIEQITDVILCRLLSYVDKCDDE